MKILVTGAKGFIGQNLVAELKNQHTFIIFEYNRDTDNSRLEKCCKEADFVFHLAGVSRPDNRSEYRKSNYVLTVKLLETLRKYNNACPIVFTSSIQAELENLYGRSKKDSEDLLFDYSLETGAKALVYRLPNVFGKWSKPNYNSVIATFCYNVNNNLPVTINGTKEKLNLVYIDDLVAELILCLSGRESRKGKYCEVPVVYSVKLDEIADLIYAFKRSRSDLTVPDLGNDFIKKLYSTYLSFLPFNQFSYHLDTNIDTRGSFTEFIKFQSSGQVSINITKPGVVKGNHWHHTKSEKFLVVKGKGIVRFRRVGAEKVTEYHVSDENLEVVDIPPGYAHQIENVGDDDLITVIWASDTYSHGNPDTYYQGVYG